jgi:hypothetical protein
VGLVDAPGEGEEYQHHHDLAEDDPKERLPKAVHHAGRLGRRRENRNVPG